MTPQELETLRQEANALLEHHRGAGEERMSWEHHGRAMVLLDALAGATVKLEAERDLARARVAKLERPVRWDEAWLAHVAEAAWNAVPGRGVWSALRSEVRKDWTDQTRISMVHLSRGIVGRAAHQAFLSATRSCCDMNIYSYWERGMFAALASCGAVSSTPRARIGELSAIGDVVIRACRACGCLMIGDHTECGRCRAAEIEKR